MQVYDSVTLKYPLSLLSKYRELSPAFVDDFCKRIRIIKPKARNTLLLPGDICHDLYLIEKGMLACYEHVGDKSYCSWIMMPGDFVTAVPSFNYQLISSESIVALKNSLLYAMNRQDFEHLTNTYHEFMAIRLGLTDYYHVQSRMMDVQRKHPPEEFYDYLCKNFPAIVKEAPKTALAALMGITRQTLYNIMDNYK